MLSQETNITSEFDSNSIDFEELIASDSNSIDFEKIEEADIFEPEENRREIKSPNAKKWTIKSDGKFEAAGAYTIDMNAGELILDANANTSITADTDDQIDIKIAGADDFRFTANESR